MNNFAKSVLILVVLVASLIAGNLNTEQEIKSEIIKMFMKQYNVSKDQLNISYLRFPDLSNIKLNSVKIDVYSQKQVLKLGYQTLWVKLTRNNKIVQKSPVSLETSITTDVLVTTKKIHRHQKIEPDMVKIEKRQIDDNWYSLLSSVGDIQGMETERVLQKGTLLTKRLVRPIPLVQRGDAVKVQIETSSLVLTSSGIAKSDGGLGSTVTVERTPGGKKMKAQVRGAGLVVVSQESSL